jgi:hypothetical protein
MRIIPWENFCEAGCGSRFERSDFNAFHMGPVKTWASGEALRCVSAANPNGFAGVGSWQSS